MESIEIQVKIGAFLLARDSAPPYGNKNLHWIRQQGCKKARVRMKRYTRCVSVRDDRYSIKV